MEKKGWRYQRGNQKDRKFNGQKKKIDNSMAKRKRIKREAMPYTTLHRKLNSVQYELHKKENGSEWNVWKKSLISTWFSRLSPTERLDSKGPSQGLDLQICKSRPHEADRTLSGYNTKHVGDN